MSRVPESYGEMLIFLMRGSGAPAILILLAAAILAKSVLGAWHWHDGLVVAVFFLLRGVLEWLVHACLYHARPLPFVGIRLVSRANADHVLHHQNPNDLGTLLITYRGVLVLVGFVSVLALMFTRNLDTTLTTAIAFMLVGLGIEVVHLICHCAIPHRSAFMRKMVSLHRAHHWGEQEVNFGVTSSLGDYIFKTQQGKQHD